MARSLIRSALAVFAAAAAAAITVVTATAATPAAASGGGWTGAWATALTPQGPFVGQNTFDDQSIRMIVQTTSVGGYELRIRLSNRHGESDLVIGAATVGRPAAESTPDLVPWSVRELSFGGSASVTIPAGGEVYSDSVGFWAPPLSQLAVTIYLPEPSGPVPDPPGWTPEQEATRQAVNAYIRTTGDADGVVDADRALRDPRDPTRVAARFAAEDGVHTNDLGNRAWARAVPLWLL